MLLSSQSIPTPLDSRGVWVDLPVQESESLFHASIYDLKGRRMTGQLLCVADEQAKHHWDFDHTGWPKGSYVLEVKGKRVLRQTKLVK